MRFFEFFFLSQGQRFNVRQFRFYLLIGRCKLNYRSFVSDSRLTLRKLLRYSSSRENLR